MTPLKVITRQRSRFSTLAALKKKWQDLSSYITKDSDMAHWRELNAKLFEAEVLVQKQEREEFRRVDWGAWAEKISNKEALICMKKFYDHQMNALDELDQSECKEAKEKKKCKEDELFEEALKNCKEAEKASAKLLVDGAKTLWINFHNPPVSNLDNNEWIDSDLYWQAFVEKHATYNLNNKTITPEDEENKNIEKNEWMKKTTKFNERSDTPILYDYMINLPSWEHYDINRRIFLENMIYFLLRTGLSYKFFPELFSWKWKTHIEDLRFQFLEVAQRRRKNYQLVTAKREVPLELQPSDYEHKGEEYHLKLLQHFRDYQNLVLSRLMGNYIFLCDPFIPVQTEEMLQHVLSTYEGGKLFKLCNDQVNCLFYLPAPCDENKTTVQYKPLEALDNFFHYLKGKNIKVNDSYSSFLKIISQVLQERGEYWLNLPNENFADSFLRRYNKDDSMYPIFVDYVAQLRENFENKVEVSPDMYHEEVSRIEEKYLEECSFFDNLIGAFLTEDISLSHEQGAIPDLVKLDTNQIKKLLSEGKLKVVHPETGEQVRDPDLIAELARQKETERQEIQEFVKSLPA
ncbi:conserved protein, unknown function [Plasmodium knowlesi strain H]|uniref:Uncharacterized protein n=3 Tax=Plasmodium knowlesi TaxID=5850 RepID=A0A5K1U3N0_PLAKH|nr:uncharacterized protein PKNH_0830600 [Plasmodium knowlesi strain H]OTN65820.1 Uncharacterized protein PKNOH_S100059400 [Plasmodium knowlesi]CAA9987947.1 ATP synthase F0 subunit d-like protein, putative [Plasmodium knowlesi strain H]SBO22183.1 conserved protein, unknown function [Plasmodium knowlesi strain H]SBO29194.1 conserved protein, unknown function [Plasmodium knowlesi strain H]VVS77421.1 ATP synthase F0 subunit d-like protein, putative [Plasmodium knowlesi strain H]|eukprot:XP_002258927.1 [Plasmodium knowlesi strain H]